MGLAALKIEDLPQYTYDDYVQWEGQWEIIKGIPYAMGPAPAKKHQRISLKIASQLDTLLENCPRCTTYLPIDWQIDEYTVVQPDVLVVCNDNPLEEQTKLVIPPVLVFEIISSSTARKDRIIKYQLYQNAGVKYYCIVDPGTDSADVFVLQHDSFRKTEPFKDGKMLFDLGPCQIQLDFFKIFR